MGATYEDTKNEASRVPYTIVKGDNNPDPDIQKPKIPDITGVVIFVIPLIGKFLTPKALIVLIPLIFGLWLIFDALKNE